MGLRKDCSGDFHDRRVGRDDLEGDELGLVGRCIGGVRETPDAFVLKGEVVVGDDSILIFNIYSRYHK